MELSTVELESALTRLGESLQQSGLVIDIAVYGGAAMLLAFDARRMTRDVDAVVLDEPEAKRQLFEHAARLAREHGWDSGWINDGVKGFLSANPDNRFFRSYPTEAQPGLRVFIPSAEYLLAMKLLAMRFEPGKSDLEDIRALAAKIGVRSAAQAVQILETFYASDRIPAKSHFGIQELFGTDG